MNNNFTNQNPLFYTRNIPNNLIAPNLINTRNITYPTLNTLSQIKTPNSFLKNILPNALKTTRNHKITFSSILNGANKTLNIINQTIPIYNQVKPIWKNAKTILKVSKEINSTNNLNKKNITNSANNEKVENKKTEKKESNSPTFFI